MTDKELEVRPQVSVPALPGTSCAEWADELMAWAAAAQKAHEIATVLCETSFVPKSMAHRPGDVTGAILMAMELNVPVMWALGNIDIIDGTPGIRAKALRALALRQGHEIWVEESNKTRAIVCARRKGSQRIEKSKWDLDRAKTAGLLGKKNWREYPQDMLVSRATAEVIRLTAPDDLLGGMYTVDELGGDEAPGEPIAATVAEPAPTRRRTAQRAKPEPQVSPEDLPTDIPEPVVVVDEATAIQTMEAAGFEVVDVIDTLESPEDAGQVSDPLPVVSEGSRPVDEPDWPEPVAPGSGGEPEPKMSDAQRRRMAVAMKKVRLVERAERLDFVSETVGRPVESSNDLTVAEASKVIQALIDLDDRIQQGLAKVQPTEGEN